MTDKTLADKETTDQRPAQPFAATDITSNDGLDIPDPSRFSGPALTRRKKAMALWVYTYTFKVKPAVQSVSVARQRWYKWINDDDAFREAVDEINATRPRMMADELADRATGNGVKFSPTCLKYFLDRNGPEEFRQTPAVTTELRSEIEGIVSTAVAKALTEQLPPDEEESPTLSQNGPKPPPIRSEVLAAFDCTKGDKRGHFMTTS